MNGIIIDIRVQEFPRGTVTFRAWFSLCSTKWLRTATAWFTV